ncbi:MAG TPA: HWE histidine kinase domain-containing protein, partial [Hyphomicrobiaceae bacterium]|nr:HWE histidine kinase domain-containing protein [Hyphomicrobiaceae bacterium]
LTRSLGSRLDEIAAILPCDGAALWLDGELCSWGECPPRDEFPAIVSKLDSVVEGAVLATHELAKLHPPAERFAGEASGLLALPLSRNAPNFLLLFRREFVRTISWAGNPTKPFETGPIGTRLTPRKSFELWREEVKNQSRPWSPQDRLTAEALRTSLLEIVLKYSEIVAVERSRADQLQRIQNAEFNHRVKNALALIGALVSQSKAGHETLSSFVADLEGRGPEMPGRADR